MDGARIWLRVPWPHVTLQLTAESMVGHEDSWQSMGQGCALQDCES
jgi:hypothetical protein